MTSKDPEDGPGLYARNASLPTYELRDKGTSTGIKAKFYDQESERALVGMALSWPDHAGEIVSKIDLPQLGDDPSRKAIVALRKLIAVNGVISVKTVAENVTDWPTALNDLVQWMAEAPFYSERELNSRVLSIRAASDNRQLYKAGEMLREALESGDGGGTKVALNRLTELSQLAESGSGGVDLSPLQVNFSVLFSKETQRREFLIDPLVPRGGQIVIYSEPKTGKSLFALNAAVVLATGKAGLGMGAREPISVMYLDYENTEDDLLDRLESMGFSEEDDLSNLHYFQLAAIPPLDTREGGEWIREAKKEFEPQFVIIDTMARAVAGEENSADTYRRYYQHVGLFLKSQKITLLRLDHAGKDATKGQRGSSDKAGDVDAVYRLSTSGNLVTLTCTHQRISWIAKEARFRKLDDPLRHEPENQSYTQQAIEFAKTLDELDISLDATRAEVVSSLKQAGLPGKRVETITEAQKIRRDRKNRSGKIAFKNREQCPEQPFGNNGGNSREQLEKIPQIVPLSGVIDREQSTGTVGNTQREQSATPIRGAVPSAGFEDNLEAVEFTDQSTPQSDLSCKVCGKALLFPDSVAKGICARRDEAHQAYNGQEEPPPLSDEEIAKLEAMYADEAVF
jgi:KaiC/GvpD/RAD55 family RecA-like ATPase